MNDHTKPAIESVAGYSNGKAPAAATFGRGATDLAEIKRAAEARCEHSLEISNRKATP